MLVFIINGYIPAFKSELQEGNQIIIIIIVIM